MSILDFKELSTSRAGSPAGEDLEGLTRELGKRLGLEPRWSGRGADQGRDLFFTERRTGALGSEELRWLVSCKDFANSGRSVSENDVGSVLDKVTQHGADGFLLVTTTTTSTGLKAKLDGIHSQGNIKIQIWDRHELESLLLLDSNVDLIKRHLPLSYAALRRLSSLPQALDALETFLPGSVYTRIRRIIETFYVEETWLSGDKIWPHDKVSANTIDLVIEALLDENDSVQAARTFLDGKLDTDAFAAALTSLATFKPQQAKELCVALIKAKHADGMSLFTYRFYVDHYELSNEDQIMLATELASDDLYELYADEVSQLVDEEFSCDPAKYGAWDHLDALSTHTMIEEVYVQDISLTADSTQARITFHASVQIAVSLSYDREGPDSSSSFPGNAKGLIDAFGMYLQDVTVDTRSFYE